MTNPPILPTRHVAIVLYNGFTALDAVGPYEVLVSLPDTTVHFISDQLGPVWADTKQLALSATATWDQLPHPSIIVIPGGSGNSVEVAASNPALIQWLKTAHETSQWTTSVCTGMFLLGAIGILQGLQVTTHWGPSATCHPTPGQPMFPNALSSRARLSPPLASPLGSIWHSFWLPR